MTLGFALKIFFEIGMVMLIAYGIIHEDKLIAFENELAPLLKFMFKKYILKEKAPVSGKKANAHCEHREAVRRSAKTQHRAEIKRLPVNNDFTGFKNVA